jgi:hypothetical protein
MFVLAQDVAEAVASSDVKVDDPGLFGNRLGRTAQQCALPQACAGFSKGQARGPSSPRSIPVPSQLTPV